MFSTHIVNIKNVGGKQNKKQPWFCMPVYFSPHILECPLHGRSYPKILVTIALIMDIFLSASYRNGKPEREVVCMTLQWGQCKARQGHYDENVVLSFASFC